MIGLTREQIIQELSRFRDVKILKTFTDAELAEEMRQVNACGGGAYEKTTLDK